jgi:DNA polymerase III alpha subunit
MKDAYVRRAHGDEPVAHLHPRLEPILNERFGILLYEEDVMACAAALTGGTLADGDLLRRAIKKSGKEERARLKAEFVRRARASGVRGRDAEAVWTHLEKFAEYGFCRAHAAGYGVLAWRSALLKARYPAAYACAVMNNHAGMYPARVHLEEAKRMGVRVRPPCVNASADGFSLDADGSLRVGLARVHGLAERTRERIFEARDRKPFASLAGFLRRVPAAFREVEALVLGGAFDFTGRTRPELLYRLRVLFECEREEGRRRHGALFGEDLCPGAGLRLPQYDPWTLLRREGEVLGLFAGDHPMAVLRPDLPPGTVPAARLPDHAGKRVAVAGILSARRGTRTARTKEKMAFVTLEDESGLVECTLFPRAYRRWGGRFRSAGPFLASGRVEDRFGSCTLSADAVRPLERTLEG